MLRLDSLHHNDIVKPTRRQQAVIVVIPEGLLQSRVELDHLRRQLQVRRMMDG